MTFRLIRNIQATGTSLIDMYLEYAAVLEKLGSVHILYEFPTYYPSDGVIHQMNVELHYEKFIVETMPAFLSAA